MKKGLLFIFLTIFSLNLSAQMMSLEGSYQGKNIYVQIPFAADGASFCTDSVRINGKKIQIKNANAFEIRLDSLGLVNGQKILLEIFHKADCKPKIIADNSSPKVSFDIVSISVDSAHVLYWTTINESGKLPFVIETYIWNKWVKLGEVDGIGTSGENKYKYGIPMPHSGTNKLRVKQYDYKNQPRLSAPVSFDWEKNQVKIVGNKNKLWEVIQFNERTMYELYDKAGNILKKGTGINIGIKGLGEDLYYLNYDDKTETVYISPH